MRLKNAGHDEKQVTFLQIFLCAVVRTIGKRAQLNRFVVGQRLYQRKQIEISFAVKKKFSDDAGLTTVKIAFSADETLDSLQQKVNAAIGVGKGTELTTSEKEVNLLTKLPRFMLRFIMWCQRALDANNLLPSGMIKPDPMYASMFIANLGSVGLEAAYHHLYEYGTIPLFGVIGRIHKTQCYDPDSKEFKAQDQVEIKWTYDERIADGFYCARSLEILKELIENPQQLEQVPE